MKIQNSINVYNNGNINNYNNKDITFQGIPVRAILKEISYLPNEDKLWMSCADMGKKLGIPSRTIKSLLNCASKKQIDFMENLTEYYNARNWSFAGDLKEDSQLVIDIYKMVEKPTPQHKNLIDYSEVPLKTLKNLFVAAQDKKSLEFVSNMQTKVLDGSKKSAEIITAMLNSRHKENYITDFSRYKSYILLNREDENVVKNLDNLVSSGKYNAKTYDSMLAVKEILNYSALSDNLAEYADKLSANYSAEGKALMDKIAVNFLAYRKGLSKQDYAHIVDIYSTTTKENLSLRLNLIDKFKYSYTDGYSKISDTEALKLLFDRIDANNVTASFVTKALGDDINVKSIEELISILNLVPPKKAEIFHKNISNIVRYTTEHEERVAALESEVENPFFITPQFKYQKDEAVKYGFNATESKWQTLMTKLENEYNIRKYNHYLKTHEDIVPSLEKKSENINVVLPNPIEKSITPVVENKSEINSSLLPVKFVKHPKELPVIKKLRVKIGVNDIIEQKLGAKTLARQKADYIESANVMRLKLLPEIFRSIKETRKQQKASGMKSSIDTREALKLYEKITGKNRKLIHYMLKQTNSDNERIFTIRDINSVINRAETEILKSKKTNPSYKAADAKAVYEDISQTMVEKYGKLRRVKKQS